ncbi:MAG: hypothetical protein ACLP5V_07855 [Candidatus Bathyarchaeia archaeon]
MPEKKATTNKTLLQLLKEEERQVAKWSRMNAEKLLVQVEDTLAKLCEDNDVAKAAIQIITERSNHAALYTPEQATDGYWARCGYEEATVSVGELYGSLTQLLGRVIHGPDSYGPTSYVGRGVWRILDSYHPDQRFRFYQVKDKPRRRRVR